MQLFKGGNLMPEYLAPGVYVEETSFRSKSIEGVSTSTAGFVGPTRWGPVCGDPELITSLADFERMYGGPEELSFTDQELPSPNYLWHGVRAFFEEGGQRLYVSRAFNFGVDLFEAGVDPDTGIPNDDSFYAKAGNAGQPFALVARFPGEYGNGRVTFTVRGGSNAFVSSPKPGTPHEREYGLTHVQGFSVVHVSTAQKDAKGKITGWTPFSAAVASSSSGSPSSPPSSATSSGAGGGPDGLFLAHWNAQAAEPQWELIAGDGSTPLLLQDLTSHDGMRVRTVTVIVEVEYPVLNPQGLPGFGPANLLGQFDFDPRSAAGLSSTFVRNPTTRSDALTIPFSIELKGKAATLLQPTDDNDKARLALDIARELLGPAVLNTLNNVSNQPDAIRVRYVLTGGKDGLLPGFANYAGDEFAFRDFLNNRLQSPKNGLLAFESVEDISIVAAPGYSAHPVHDELFAIQSAVIDHCEKMRYRVAVLDTPPHSLVSDALAHRNLRSSKYAALYYPWVTILDPLTDVRLNLPASGFVAGIYARNDIEHAVFKAPANEVVRLAIDFEQRLNKAQQDVLNPEGVNCFRYFPGHGFLLWGARTISDDSEWKYVNVRRYFAYLEHSIDRGTQWVVFENNSRPLWDNVRRTIEDFLLNEWKMGALMGDKPEQAYFVRCDQTTMTQNDFDNGRLVCLIGVAVVKPAEFVIFRIGQWTARTNN
jgi:uncharacterized protein